MRLVELQCKACSTTFQRVKKEIDRQKRRGRSKFYCSRKCAGAFAITSHLNVWSRSAQNLENLKTRVSRAKNPFKAYHRRLRARCLESSKIYEVDLTIAYLENLWVEQDGKCAISGLPMQHKSPLVSPLEQASLDRIDSDVGYIQGNVQFILLPLNYAKGQVSDAEFRAFYALLTTAGKATK